MVYQSVIPNDEFHSSNGGSRSSPWRPEADPTNTVTWDRPGPLPKTPAENFGRYGFFWESIGVSQVSCRFPWVWNQSETHINGGFMMVNSGESWNLGVSIVMGLPNNEWFFRENLFRNGWWLGVPKNFRKPPYDTLLGGLIWWLICC